MTKFYPRDSNARVICVSGPLGTGDTGDIAGLKCRDLTADESPQCRRCAQRLPYASMYVLVCVCSVFSETNGPTEAKFHVEPQWDRGKKFIKMIPVICFYIVMLWGRGFLKGFYHKCEPAVQGF